MGYTNNSTTHQDEDKRQNGATNTKKQKTDESATNSLIWTYLLSFYSPFFCLLKPGTTFCGV